MKRYDEDGNPYGVAHYIKVALKALIILIAIAIIALFIFRKQMMNDKGDMEKLIWTEEAVAAYNTSPEDFSVRSIYDYNTKDTNNIFNVSATRYIPSACELQFTIRSNESTLSRAILEPCRRDPASCRPRWRCGRASISAPQPRKWASYRR